MLAIRHDEYLTRNSQECLFGTTELLTRIVLCGVLLYPPPSVTLDHELKRRVLSALKDYVDLSVVC